MSPMCMYSSSEGFATDFHLVHLGSRAMGGFGLVFQEATAVSPEGRITADDLGIWKDEHIDKLTEVVEFVHQYKAKIGIQLAHAGRKASTRSPLKGRGIILPDEEGGWETVAPSTIPFIAGEINPKALDTVGLQKVKADFIAAARRAKKIGYDVLEIHAAHGYLLHQFLSPISNHRTDQYGGNLANRMRLLIEITEAVKQEWGDEKPLFVRISATDWVDNGWQLEDSITLSIALKKLGVDMIDVSSGGTTAKANIPIQPGYQVDFSAEIKEKANIKTGAVGLITSAQQAEEILQKNHADLVFLGREALRHPYFPKNTATDLDNNPDWCKQYEWSLLPKKKKSIP